MFRFFLLLSCLVGIQADKQCCGNPTTPQNAQAPACSTTSSGGSCTLTCNANFKKSGDFVCQNGAWQTATCTAKASCPTPPTANAAAGVTGYVIVGTSTACAANTASGSSCTVTCATGYLRVTDAVCDDGTFSVGTCAKQCTTQPTIPANAAVAANVCASVPVSSLSTCTLVCATGFFKSDDFRCTEGVWNSPTCTSSNCGTLPSIASGSAANCSPAGTGGVYSTGTQCDVTCNSGYVASSTKITCTNSVWSTATCTANSCACPPLTTANGWASCDFPVAHQGTCSLTCANGYTKSGDFTCTAGSWNTPTCTLGTPCNNNPTTPSNAATPNCAGTASGNTCTMTCNSGYQKTGDFTCNNGNWVNAPTCIQMCSATPVTTVNGIAPTCCLPTKHLSTCELVCQSGYVSTGIYTCTNGQWNAPQCLDPRCTSLPASVANAQAPNCVIPANRLGTCALTCNAGFTKSSDWICSGNNAWNTPICSAQCSVQPAAVSNAAAPSCTLPTASGGSCTLACNTDYGKSADYVCTNGVWSTPQCQSNCNCSPNTVANGVATNCVASHLGSCTLNCQTGFTKSGDYVCNNGVWSTPTCTAIVTPPVRTCTCNPPTVPNGGTASGCDATTNGASCTATCNAGFTKSGDYLCTIASSTTMRWQVPTCRATSTSCAVGPIDVLNGCNSCTSGRNGDSCSLYCRNGYSKSGDFVCNSGVWTTPVCRAGGPFVNVNGAGQVSISLLSLLAVILMITVAL